MGVSGLFGLLKSIQKPCNLRLFAGQTIGVDAYGWLHRGASGCAIDLAQDKKTTKFVAFAMHRVRMMLHFGIKPYLVLDGDNLPSKAKTESKRRISRQESKARGLEHIRFRRTSQAFIELRKAVDITPEMAQMFISELKRANIDYVVAPYEADSQLVYLEKKGIIDGILSEDSDLLVFGANCLLTKLDQYGECVLINRKDFSACTDVSLVDWTNDQFRRLAILSGCDYLEGLHKIGLKTAYRLLRKHKSVENVVRALQLDGSTKIPDGYLAAFEQAERTFLYQWVFCPLQEALVNFTDLPSHIEAIDLPYIGKIMDRSIAIGVSQGDLNPHTKKLMQKKSSIKSFKRAMSSKRPAVHTPETKKSHTIESFFKAQRTPLAELDPNNFKPSPSQQGLLRDNPHRPWSAERAPSRIQHNTQEFQFVSRGQCSTSENSYKRTPNSYPFKRQKVYTEIASSSMDISAEQDFEVSPFFHSANSTSYAESPSVGLSKANKKADKPELFLRSDDSIEEALGDFMHSSEEITRPSKHSFKVYRAEEFERSASVPYAADTQPDESRASNKVQKLQESSLGEAYSSLDTNDSSRLDNETQATSVFSSHLSEEFANFRNKFSYGEHPVSYDNSSSTSGLLSSLAADAVCDTALQAADSTASAVKSPQTSWIEVPVSSAPSPDGDTEVRRDVYGTPDVTELYGGRPSETASLGISHHIDRRIKFRNGAKEDIDENVVDEEEEEEVALETPHVKRFADFLHDEDKVAHSRNLQAVSPSRIIEKYSVVQDSEDDGDDDRAVEIGDEDDNAESSGDILVTENEVVQLLQGEEEEGEEEEEEEMIAKPALDLSRFKFATAALATAGGTATAAATAAACPASAT